MSYPNTQFNHNHALELLEQLRAAFVAELPERADVMESLVLRLEQQAERTEIFDELYRRVHSLKGSAGTHGVPIISSVCHHLEDHLNVVADTLDSIDAKFADLCLRHVDLVRHAVTQLESDDNNWAFIEEQLEVLRQAQLQNRRSALVVESSPFMMSLCTEALRGLPVRLSTEIDGLAALARLLAERFDFLITGRSLKTLNAAALVRALRASESANRTIKVIMLTSSGTEELPSGSEPDYVVQRTATLQADLRKSASELLSKLA